MTEADALASLRSRLPRHAALLDSMSDVVTQDDRWRFLEVGCSLGAGSGDELSDIDAGVGYDGISASDLFDAARAFAMQIGVPVDLVVHRMDARPDDVCRLAAEYPDGLQLDLVVMPADRRRGLPDRSISIVDKDQQLTVVVTPPVRLPPSIEVAREWVVPGWWALATADKYVRWSRPNTTGSLTSPSSAVRTSRNMPWAKCGWRAGRTCQLRGPLRALWDDTNAAALGYG